MQYLFFNFAESTENHFTMNGIKTGNIVRFRDVVDAGDENARFLVLDDYGTDSAKCHVKQLATGLPLEPTFVYLKSDLVVVE